MAADAAMQRQRHAREREVHFARCFDPKTQSPGPATCAQVVEWAKANTIDFVVVGPEDPLTAGVVDELEKAGILAFGPNKAAAELEGSKAFMKDILQKYNVRRPSLAPCMQSWKLKDRTMCACNLI